MLGVNGGIDLVATGHALYGFEVIYVKIEVYKKKRVLRKYMFVLTAYSVRSYSTVLGLLHSEDCA